MTTDELQLLQKWDIYLNVFSRYIGNGMIYGCTVYLLYHFIMGDIFPGLEFWVFLQGQVSQVQSLCGAGGTVTCFRILVVFGGDIIWSRNASLDLGSLSKSRVPIIKNHSSFCNVKKFRRIFIVSYATHNVLQMILFSADVSCGSAHRTRYAPDYRRESHRYP